MNAEEKPKNFANEPLERRKNWIQGAPEIPTEGLTPVDLDHWEFVCTDGVFIKQMHLKTAGTYVAQHSHKYSHHSMLARGSVHVWKNEKFFAAYHAPCAILIEAGCKHTFMSLEDETIVYCIHNVSRSHGDVEILAENGLRGLEQPEG
jgi:quercetin dioxygenase-like cupin family protein